MLIIFEGNEGSGKTTISNNIAALLNTKVLKRDSFKNNGSKFSIFRKFYDLNESAFWDWRFFLEMLDPLITSGDHFVCDRSFITQEVYHRAFEQRFPENPVTVEHEDLYNDYAKILQDIPHLIIYITRDIARNDDDLLQGQWNVDPDWSKIAIDKYYNEWFSKHEDKLNVVRLENNATIQEAIDTAINSI